MSYQKTMVESFQHTKRKLESLLQWIENDEVQPRYDYSGRGMYGRTCIGIVTNDPVASVLDLMGEALDEGLDMGEVVSILRRSSQDSMGLSSIIYWPTWEAQDEHPEADDY